MKRFLGIIFLANLLIQMPIYADVVPAIGMDTLNDKIINVSLQPSYIEPIAQEEIIYKESSKIFDLIDPIRQTGISSYYPGLRGSNQLVVYTPVYGVRTGTNEFGTEAIIENNMVVSLNGADSVIPKNGFQKIFKWVLKFILIIQQIQ